MHTIHLSHLSRKHHNVDMTHGSLADKILLFALPLAVTAMLQQLFNAADIAVVGHFVGEAAMAAVGSNGALINLLVNLFIGISLGTNVVISQYTGAEDEEGIRKAVHSSLIVALLGGIGLTLFGEIFSIRILRLLAVPEDVLPLAEIYLRIYFLGMPIILLYNFEAAIFRSQGDTRTPLLVLSLSGVINVALNLFLVCVVHMTVEGVAIATVVSNLISTLILFCLLRRHEGPIRVEWSRFCVDGKVMRRILQIGVPSGIQSMMFSLSNIIIQSAVNSLGTTIMAASAAAVNLEAFAFFVLNSFGQACTTFTGQNYGAGQLERCRKVFRYCLLLSLGFTVVSCGLILFFAKPLLGIFNSEPAIVQVGIERLRIIFFAYLFSFQVEVFSGYLRGFGHSLIPALASLICVCGLRILWIAFVFPLFRTYASIVAAYPVSLSINAGVLLVCCIRVMKKIYSGDSVL